MLHCSGIYRGDWKTLVIFRSAHARLSGRYTNVHVSEMKAPYCDLNILFIWRFFLPFRLVLILIQQFHFVYCISRMCIAFYKNILSTYSIFICWIWSKINKIIFSYIFRKTINYFQNFSIPYQETTPIG